MPFQKFSFSNCNAFVKVNAPLWWRSCREMEERGDSEGEGREGREERERGVQDYPVEIKWKNLNTGEQKWYDIYTSSSMISACSFTNINQWVSLSPNGRYILLWYSTVDDIEGNLRILVIDTETQKLTEGTTEDFGEFIDKSSDQPYHGSCKMRILDNGLLHIVTASECYENYLMDPKTNEVVLNIEEILSEKLKQYDLYDCTIATPTSLLLFPYEPYKTEVRFFEYIIESGETSFQTMTFETFQDLSEKYILRI